jgi:hypothetical protein
MITELILKQNFLSNQINHMRQMHAFLAKKDSKSIEELSQKGNIEADLKLLEPMFQQVSKQITYSLESELPKDKHFRFLHSKRKPKEPKKPESKLTIS